MAIAINQVNIGGNMTRDIELITAGDTLIGKVGLAVTESKKQKDGSWGDDTQFFDITMFGKLAQRCADNLKKGDTIYVNGRLATDRWEKDGEKRMKVYVIAQDIKFLRWGKDRAKPAADSGTDESPF